MRRATLRASTTRETTMSGETADRRELAIGRGACRGVRAAQATELTVSEGRAWITVERDAADYWLEPGDALPLAAGERAWIGGWDAAVRCEIAPLAGPVTRPPIAAFGACLRRCAAWTRALLACVAALRTVMFGGGAR